MDILHFDFVDENKKKKQIIEMKSIFNYSYFYVCNYELFHVTWSVDFMNNKLYMWNCKCFIQQKISI